MRVEGASPNWNTNTGAQAVTSLISERPAVMVIHNPDVRGADECPVYVRHRPYVATEPVTFSGLDAPVIFVSCDSPHAFLYQVLVALSAARRRSMSSVSNVRHLTSVTADGGRFVGVSLRVPFRTPAMRVTVLAASREVQWISE